MRILSRLALFAAAAALTGTAFAAPSPAPAPLSSLIKQVNIPYQMFKLKNGLTVIVHEDHKAPIVAVSVWYHIGSKDEPKGKTGFAHLFEHLMFDGSENAPGDFFSRLENIGATDLNGTTWFDRTNYFETVPTGALDRALFLESDRMGHLLGAVDAEDGSITSAASSRTRSGRATTSPAASSRICRAARAVPARTSLSPLDHRLDGRSRCGQPRRREELVPRALRAEQCGAGARRRHRRADGASAKVERCFGYIPRGPDTPRPPVSVPTLPAPVDKVMHDRVATTSINREWVVPGVNDPAARRSSWRPRSLAASPARGSTMRWCARRRSRSACRRACRSSSRSRC